jgi:hypothetical protein
MDPVETPEDMALKERSDPPSENQAVLGTKALGRF